jgi:hypothetical protein
MVALGNSHEYANLSEDFTGLGSTSLNLQASSPALIFSYLEEIVRVWTPEQVLTEFRNLFVNHIHPNTLESFQVLQTIVRDNREEDFISILKRSCYILFNNWVLNGRLELVREMLQIFADPILTQKTFSPLLKRVRTWVRSFAESQNYQDLQRLLQDYFRYQSEGQQQRQWGDRYMVYQWVAQAADLNNPPEQRELASLIAQQMKNRFKCDLAMYTSRAQSIGYDRQMYPNPTIFGDDALRLIKLLVARRGDGSYEQLSRRFIDQTKTANYQDFKKNLQSYLFSSSSNREELKTLQQMLDNKLSLLYPSKHNERINSALVLVTCNRAIEWLTTENRQEPSAIFKMLVSRGNPLTLAIALLKLVLISPNSRMYLECCLADLIRYCQQLPETECQFAIQFFEVLKIALAIYAGDIEYSLVKIKQDRLNNSDEFDINNYRVFLAFKSSNSTQPAHLNSL